MASAKYHVAAGEAAVTAKIHDLGLGREFIEMNSSLIPGCMFSHGCWFSGELKTGGELVKHASDELMMFIGSDVNNHEDLGMEIVYRIENDVVTLTDTCFLFIPAGVAHGLLEVRKVRRPCLCSTCFYDSDSYSEAPAEAAAPVGAYSGQVVLRYEPVYPKVYRPAPEGFLTRLLWIDGDKLKGAPYMESVWFKCVNPSGPPSHTHEFGEVIGFLGTDPEHPEELGGVIELTVDGKVISSDKSFYTYIPAGVAHSPIIVPKLDRPLIHFSGGGKGAYVRKEL